MLDVGSRVSELKPPLLSQQMVPPPQFQVRVVHHQERNIRCRRVEVYLRVETESKFHKPILSYVLHGARVTDLRFESLTDFSKELALLALLQGSNGYFEVGLHREYLAEGVAEDFNEHPVAFYLVLSISIDKLYQFVLWPLSRVLY